MKAGILFVILSTIPILAFSADSYIYKGERIQLTPRFDQAAVVLKNDYPDSYIRNRVGGLLSLSDELKHALPGVILIKFSSKKQSAELEGILHNLSEAKDLVKVATKVYYGSSRQVTQIPGDRFVVRLRSKDDIEKLNTINRKNQCSTEGKFGDGLSFIIKSDNNVELNALELSDKYFSEGIFEYASPDFIYPDKCLLQSIPNDPYFPSQWALQNTGQLLNTGSPFFQCGDKPTVNGIPGADMNVASAWDFTTGSQSITIGIVDTGIDSLHPDLQSFGHLVSGYDAFNNVNSSAVDNGDHGTSVAGIAGAVMNNHIGISGVAPDCKLMSIAIFDINGTTTSSIIARAFDTARVRGIDVLCNSWGGGTPDQTITNAIDNAAISGRGGFGAVILFASGNDGYNSPIYPSVLPNVLSVGASTPHDQKKAHGTGNQFFWGSNYGENEIGDLDLTAPTNCYTLKSGGAYDENFWGTSASCPNAAGVAALVLSVNPNQSKDQVVSNLTRGCDKIGSVSYTTDKPNGKWSYYYGYGRINAYNSVRLAAGIDVTPPYISHTEVMSHNSTYPTLISAEIIDNDNSPVPRSGNYVPMLFYKFKKYNGAWTGFDSTTASSVNGNQFTFKIPSMGWETEVKYYIRARDNSGNESTYPFHSPDPFWLAYFAVGNITSETKKINPFVGQDFNYTLSPTVNFSNFKIVNTFVRIYMRHTYLEDESIQLFSPMTDANNNRKCLFACNGGDLDNITGAVVSDTANKWWVQGTPPYTNGSYRSDFTLKGYNGQSASGNWRIIHFDRAVGDYAFFDSVKVTLCRTTGTASSAIKLNQPSDSVILFDSSAIPGIYYRNFYVKNSGNVSLSLSNFSFTGTNASKFSLVNTPPSTVVAGDSAYFKVKFNNVSSGPMNGAQGVEDAVLNMQTNDPSKPIFKVSLQSADSITANERELQLRILVEGLYNEGFNTSKEDTVSVYLKDQNPPYGTIDIAKGYFDTNGDCLLRFYEAMNNTGYYLAIKHRNALETWSKTPQSFSSSAMNYDFTTDSSQAYGNNMIRSGQKFCLYSGDVDDDQIIDLSDLGDIFNSAFYFTPGYTKEDLNGDDFVDMSDVILSFNNSVRFIEAILP